MRNKIKELWDSIHSHVYKRRFTFVPVLLFFIFTTHVYAGWVAGYTYKSKLTIQGAQVCGATSHTNFPILIQVTGNSFKPSPTGLITSSNGYDIIFTAADGTTLLNHQIDNYNSALGSYSAWVEIPSLTPAVDTDIYMYYGNSSVVADQSTQSTWNSNFKTVYHFQNNVLNDYTSNGVNGTNSGTTNVNAKIGDGRDFDGLSNYIQTSSNDLATANNFTISAWFKADATNPSHIIWQGISTENGWGTGAGGAQEMNLSMGTCCPSGSAQSNYLSMFLGDREQQANTDVLSAESAFTNTATWQYVVATVTNLNTAPSAQLFLNGSLLSTDAGVANSFTARNLWNTNLRIGGPGASSRFFNGQIDEVRISDIVRSADWICTEFNNQNDPNTFASLINHAPELANVEATSLSYTEEDPATAITATLTASDWDNANVASASITLTGNYVNGEDQLSFTNTANITGSWDATTGKLTLTGSDTYTNYQLALRAVEYVNLNTSNPSTLTRTVSLVVNDGTDNSNTATRSITIISVNDAPVSVNDAFATTQNVASSGNVLTNDTDVEGNTLSLTTTAVSGPTMGSLTLNSNGSFTYTPNINFVGTDSFTYQVCDNGSPSACSQGVVTITVTGATPPSGCSGNNPGGGSSTSGLYAEYYTNYYNDVQNFFVTNTPALIRNTDGPFNYSNNFGGVASPIAGVNPQFFSARYRGSIYLATSGSYTFYLTADDAAYIWIDQAALVSPAVTSSALINNGGLHAAVQKQATVYLAAGLHNILIHFGNNAVIAVLKLEYSGPGIASPTIIPASAMCSSVQSTVALNDTYTTGMNVALSGTTVLVNDTNSGGNPLVVNTTPVAGPSNGSLTLNADGTFTYTPSANFVGSDNFTYQVCNTGSPSVCSQAIVFVNVVNKTPSFTKGSDQSSNEDSGVQTVTSWATAIDDGDPGITQTLTFNVSNNNNALFSAPPSIDALGVLTYTPAANANGTAIITVTLSDNGSNVSPSVNTSAAQTFTITINAVNDAPVTVTDSYTVAEVATLNQTAPGVLANDTDAEGNALTAVLGTTTSNGALTLNSNGSFVYVHNGSETTSDSFTYHSADASLSGNTVTVNITITPVNDAPVSVADSYSVAEGGTLNQTAPGVLVNDTDAEGNALTAVLGTTTSNGTLTLNSNGSFVYVHNGSETTSDSFTYNSFDGSLSGNTVTVNITITAVNDAPVTVADSYTVAEGGTINQTAPGVLANDTDAEGNALTAVLGTTTSNGTLTLNSNGSFTYVHNGSETTSDSFTYHSADASLSGNTVTVNITITPVNDAPVSVTDSYSIAEGGTLNQSAPGVLVNDTDAEGNALTAVIGTTTSNGILTLNSNGSFTYVHNGSETTSDSFTYHSADAILSGNTITVNITITPVNDAPVTVTDSYSVAEGGTITPVAPGVLVNDTDAEGNALTAVLGTTTSNGTLTLNSNGSFTYVHNGSETTSDSFTYHSADATLSGNTVTVNITVTPVNDAPVTVADSYTVAEGGTITPVAPGVLVNDTDAEGNALTAVLGTTTSNGTLTLNSNGSFVYVHNGSETTSDSFTYHSADASLSGNTVTVNITITQVNDAPVSVADSYSVAEGGTLNQSAPGVLVNDTDAEGNALTAVLGTTTSNGTLTLNSNGSFVYVHNGSETTSDSFIYNSFDGILNGNIVTVNILITAVNDAPVAIADNATTQQNAFVDIDVLSNDNDADDGLNNGSVVVISNPANGTLVIGGTGIITYTPAIDYVGSDSFVYMVSDNTGVQSLSASVSINVTPVNSAPNAVDDAIEHRSILPVSINVLANDSDSDNDRAELTIISVTQPSIGSVNIDNNQIIYLPAGETSGTVTFTYTIQDPGGLSSQATVTIEYQYDPFKVSEGFSPNGDGNNETWYIRNIEAHPNNIIQVFDRWGILVYRASKYDNASVVWDGRANTGIQTGNLVDGGTYFYSINLGDKASVLSGYIEIVR